MGQMLQADIDALRGLAKTLAVAGDSINGIPVTATAAMLSSAVDSVSAGVREVVTTAYKALGDRIRSMADAATASATTYEAADQAFGEQLQKYETGF